MSAFGGKADIALTCIGDYNLFFLTWMADVIKSIAMELCISDTLNCGLET
jgi:hypothetical protein